MPDPEFDLRYGHRAAGIDEAGRGPIAGPVVAAAVILPAKGLPTALAGAIDDSKKVPAARRERLFAAILECASVGIGEASVDEIDIHNVLQATMIAMSRAVRALPEAPEFALVDGNRLPVLDCPGEAVVGGDGLSLSIGAASIVAKVTRDRIMHALAPAFPDYGWEANVGYGTAAHLAALDRLGPTRHHRRSFAPVARFF